MADSYGSKSSLLIMPVIMIGMFLMVAALEFFPGAWNFPVKITEENRETQLTIGYCMVGTLKILMVGVFVIAGIASVFPGFPFWPMYLLMALMGVAIAAGIGCSVRAR